MGSCKFINSSQDEKESSKVETPVEQSPTEQSPVEQSPADNSPAAGTRSANLDFIFNNESLGTTKIKIKRSEWNKLCDNYRYFFKNENCVHAEEYVYQKDGKSWTLKNVGFRLRGNTSRYCPQGIDNGNEQEQMNADWNAAYYAYANQPNNDYRQTHFKVDFEEFLGDDEEQKLADCLKGIALKRMDGTCTREIFCYDLFRKNGIWTAPRASHTRLILEFVEDQGDGTITTIDYGVYEMFEEVNKQSLKARDKDENNDAAAWKNSKGNLWKCSNPLTKDSINWGTGVEDIRIVYKGDVQPAGMKTNGREDSERIGYVWNQYSLDLKTNKSDLAAASTELKAFVTELNNLPTAKNDSDTASISKIKAFYEKWFDVDFFLRTYAINIICGMDDDYWGNANNFYLYFGNDKNDNKKVWLIPFDYDNTLGSSINGDKEGFKHDPLDWGRGADRPLMDKLLSVPEYREKFKSYLVEYTEEDSLWNYERCSGIFYKWNAMVSPYLNSPDLCYTGLGVNGFYYGTWNPDGFSLVDKSTNIYDYTRYYIRKNLGIDVSDSDIAKMDAKPLPDSDQPEEIVQKSTGSSKDADGAKLSISGVMNYAGQKDTTFSLSVKPKYNGLYIEKAHDSAWTHISIFVRDETDGVDNVRIVTDQNHNSFLYPFVQKGHKYKVWFTGQDANWANWSRFYKDKDSRKELIVEALGGEGNYRVTYEDYHYDSPSYSIVFDGLTYARPALSGVNTWVDASICDDGEWRGNTSYPGNIKFVKSTADLSPANAFLYKKDRLFIVLTLKFKYQENDYEYTIFQNNNDTLIQDLH